MQTLFYQYDVLGSGTVSKEQLFKVITLVRRLLCMSAASVRQVVTLACAPAGAGVWLAVEQARQDVSAKCFQETVRRGTATSSLARVMATPHRWLSPTIACPCVCDQRWCAASTRGDPLRSLLPVRGGRPVRGAPLRPTPQPRGSHPRNRRYGPPPAMLRVRLRHVLTFVPALATDGFNAGATLGMGATSAGLASQLSLQQPGSVGSWLEQVSER